MKNEASESDPHDSGALIEQTASEALRASELRYRRLFESAKDGILILDAETGMVVDVNPFLIELLGFSHEEFLGKAIWELGFFKDIAANETKFAELKEREYVRYENLPMETSYGRQVEVEFVSNVYLVNRHKVIQCNIRDITERKRSQEELQNLRKAVEQTANSIMITDTRGNIKYVNPAFENSSGYTKAEALGQNPSFLKGGEQDKAFYLDLWATITSGKNWQGEFHNKRKDGTHYWESATVSPVQNNKGEILAFIGISVDITKQKAMEANLNDALVCAEVANRAKSEFLAMMSHELRTPLTGVLGFAELLANTKLEEEQRKYACKITSSGRYLLAIVNDILDFSSIEKGTLAIRSSPLAVEELVNAAADSVRNIADGKAVGFRCEIAADIPNIITGDSGRICQVLTNLLANAVKFTSSGSVGLCVVSVSQDGRRFLDFFVEDTGIGISSETLNRLFQPFVQADSSSTRLFEGAGLGLVISKRIAEAMGGSITVVSTPGKGSTFKFRLPMEVPTAIFSDSVVPAPIEPKPEPSPQETTVLVVDDDQVCRNLAGKILKILGYRAEFSTNGEMAVKAFAAGRFSAILMDVSMPVMNGLIATKQIREIEAPTGSHVPIIALTANVMPGYREQYLAAGMDDLLLKPFKMAELAAKLASVAQRS